MDRQQLEEILEERELSDTVFFENPGYFNAIIGLSTDDRLVYSFDKMVQCLVDEDGMTEEDAIEFIEYNTIRALAYKMGEKMPIVVYDNDGMFE